MLEDDLVHDAVCYLEVEGVVRIEGDYIFLNNSEQKD